MRIRTGQQRLRRVLAFGGYLEFNLPRLTTAVAAAALMGVVGTHLYVVLGTPVPQPGHFRTYSTAVIVGCLLAAGLVWLPVPSLIPRLGWLLGSAVCAAVGAAYLATRWSSVPGLVGLTGRWDVAPGTITLGCAALFIAVHTSVWSGVNAAVGRPRRWRE